MDRRQIVKAGIALPVLSTGAAPLRGQARAAIPIADMHFHSFFSGPGGAPSQYDSRPVGALLKAGGATLVAWALTGDLLWVDWKKYKQNKDIIPGEALGWFERELGRIKAQLASEQIKTVRRAADVDLALAGDPHVVLAVEGATFLEAESARVQTAFDRGVRHLQLAHYIRNPLGDIQTETAHHQGLTAAGHAVIRECNRLGILIDLAHSTPNVVRDALAASTIPLVWSHGSVVRGPAAPPSAPIWRARQLPVETARAIAARGGVVGLWALSIDVGRTPEAYADRLLEMADWLGDDHVAFGTDINGLGPNAALRTYADVRRVVEHWQSKGVPERRIRKLASENYARVLKAALASAGR